MWLAREPEVRKFSRSELPSLPFVRCVTFVALSYPRDQSGSGDGQLRHPDGIAAADGLIAVADAGNYRVSLFTIGGQFVRQVALN